MAISDTPTRRILLVETVFFVIALVVGPTTGLLSKAAQGAAGAAS